MVSGEKPKPWPPVRAMAIAAPSPRIGPTEPDREDRSKVAEGWLRAMRAHERLRCLEAGEPPLRIVPDEPAEGPE